MSGLRNHEPGKLGAIEEGADVDIVLPGTSQIKWLSGDGYDKNMP